MVTTTVGRKNQEKIDLWIGSETFPTIFGPKPAKTVLFGFCGLYLSLLLKIWNEFFNRVFEYIFQLYIGINFLIVYWNTFLTVFWNKFVKRKA